MTIGLLANSSIYRTDVIGLKITEVVFQARSGEVTNVMRIDCIGFISMFILGSSIRKG